MRAIVFVLRSALAEMWRDPLALLRVVLAPMMVLVVIEMLPTSDVGPISLVVASAAGAVWCVMAIRTHRFVLLGPEGEPERFIASDFVRFALLLFAISVFAAFVAFLPWTLLTVLWPSVPAALILLCLVFFCYFSAGLSLILPDRALGRRRSVREVWSWSDGKRVKLMLALYLPGIALTALVVLVTYLVPEPLFGFVTTVLNVPVAVFQVVLLSVAYRSLAPEAE